MIIEALANHQPGFREIPGSGGRYFAGNRSVSILLLEHESERVTFSEDVPTASYAKNLTGPLVFTGFQYMADVQGLPRAAEGDHCRRNILCVFDARRAHHHGAWLGCGRCVVVTGRCNTSSVPRLDAPCDGAGGNNINVDAP